MIHGVHAALVTPRRDGSNEIDHAAALDLVEFACGSGLDGIVLLGTTGEFVHFDIGDRVKLMRLAIKRSRLPVTVNVSHSTLEGAIHLARESAACGAASLLLMPPYFFGYSQSDIESFYLRFAREADSNLPTLIYNMPAVTTPLEFGTVMRLIATGLFTGVKDSSGRLDDFRRMKAVKSQTPFCILIGADQVFAEARQEGADGAISGVASAVPELLVGLEKAIAEGSGGKRDRLEARLHEFVAWASRFPIPIGVRLAVGLRGLKVGPAACPPGSEAAQRISEFREWFHGWLPAVLEEARA